LRLFIAATLDNMLHKRTCFYITVFKLQTTALAVDKTLRTIRTNSHLSWQVFHNTSQYTTLHTNHVHQV